MINNQSIAEMTLQDLESLINRIVDEKINQINLSKDNQIERTELVNKIHILQENLKQKYGVFPDVTELLREDRDK
jgi:predicted ribosome quality control (RQC) complex YloA/Tae2 family protein